MLSDALHGDELQTDREDFFEKFSVSDNLFPYLIYSAATKESGNSSQLDFITIVYGLEWPTSKGRPVQYTEIEQKDPANFVVATIYRTIDFLERHLGVEVKLFDVRMGCVRARYSYGSGLNKNRIIRALELLNGASKAYSISSISARFEGRSVRIPE